MKAAVFDFETTGFVLHPASKDSVQPRMIEAGLAVVDQSGEVLESLEQLINPGMQISDEITKVTGITNDDLVGQPRFADVWPQMREKFDQCDIALAHNLPFDYNVLRLELERHQIIDFTWPQYLICTVEENIMQWGRRPKLVDWYKDTFDEKLAQTHRALEDVLALVEIINAQKCIPRVIAASQGALGV